MPPPAAALPDGRLFREVTGAFATGVTVVTTVADGVDHAMTVNSFSSVSLDPPLVMFCAERTGRFHAAVLAAGFWAVSVLGTGHREASDWFAAPGRPLDDQLDGWPTVRGAETGAPLLAGALAALECRTRQVHEAGDHSIVVGQVLSLDLPDPDAEPLVFHRGGYRALDR
ncbi:flavin reductase family protein [Actinomadura sp. PM05-2]|uniref:Flavin reductase family protein n=1 Tax=Actinomadura parmotrematis TaxID=2864039 RepID=A0ABS7FM50_9ACTN|nr:flavin reductase family protein [Actinomadura parmotrematis]